VLVLAVVVALGVGYFVGGGGDYCSKGPRGTVQDQNFWFGACRQT
jgi:hypothetical protein